MRAKKINKFAITLLLSSSLTSYALAESATPLKRLIMTDCPLAQSEVQVLNIQERQKLLPYLKLILKMDLAPMDPVIPAPRANLKTPNYDFGYDPTGASVWHSFDPKPGTDVKLCALKLLQIIGAQSAYTLGEITRLTLDPEITEELREKAAQTAQEILKQVLEQGLEEDLSPAIDSLLQVFIEERSALAFEFLEELGLPVVDQILKIFQKQTSDSQDILLDLLFSSSLRKFIWSEDHLRQLFQLGEEQRWRVAYTLREPIIEESDGTLVILELIDDSSVRVRLSLLESLAIIVQNKERYIKFQTAEILPIFLHALKHNELSERQVALEGLVNLQAEIVPFTDQIHYYLDNPDPEVRAKLIQILGQAAKTDSKVFHDLTDALYDKNLQVAVEAVYSLTNVRSRRDDVNSAYLRLLKSSSIKLEDKQQLTHAIGRALTQAKFTYQNEAFLPYFVDLLLANVPDQTDRTKFTEFTPELSGAELGILAAAQAGNTIIKKLVNSKQQKQAELGIRLMGLLEQTKPVPTQTNLNSKVE